ncbi:MAG: hypothetical protein LBV48_01235 [Mycoplasmataceae bacterium]|jgi:type III secretory pathway component EscV|nr:hypothetical protein [Mycoplasmataceae bacterium]
MATNETMLKYIAANEEVFFENEKSERLKTNYREASIDDDKGILKKYGILTRYNSQKKNTTETDSEIHEQRNELLNVSEVKKIFKQLKISFDKLGDEKLKKVIVEQVTDMVEFIETSEERKLEKEEKEILRLKHEYEEREKELQNKRNELSTKKSK